jgi:hypothetical protein
MAQQQAAQLQQQGIPVPAPQPAAPMQPPVKPPGPFDPRLPIDDEPMAAKIRHRELAKLMASTKFASQPPEWQQVLIDCYTQDKNAAGIMTVPDVQKQKAIEAASMPPALPHGVTIAMKGDESNVAREQAAAGEQAALQGFQPATANRNRERNPCSSQLIVALLVIAIVYVALTYLPLPPIVRQVGVVVLVIGFLTDRLWLIGLLTGHQIVRL